MSKIPKNSKSTNRQHHEQLLRASKVKTPELLRSETKPTVFWYLWEWFCELHVGEHLSYMEMKAWSEMTGNNPSQYETAILKKLNRKALAS